jgi:Arc/MetJ family transcription regulator
MTSEGKTWNPIDEAIHNVHVDKTPLMCMICIIYTMRRYAMRTNIVINDDLLDEAFSVSASRTKKGLIHEALRELIRIRKIKDLTDLAGQIEFHKGFNHKKLRKTRG